MNIAIVGIDESEELIKQVDNNKKSNIAIRCILPWHLKKGEDPYYKGIPLVDIEKLSEMVPTEVDAVVILTKDSHITEGIIATCRKYGIYDFIIPKLFELEQSNQLIDDQGFVDEKMFVLNKESHSIVQLETHIIDYCNLNCKACNNYSPTFDKGEVNNADQFRKDLHNLREKINVIMKLFLLGGEPLLDPDRTIEFIQIAREEYKNSEIRLLTNALLVGDMKKEFWEQVVESDIIIQITGYPPTMEKENLIQDVLTSNHVKFVIEREISVFSRQLTLYPFEDEYISNEYCGSAGCHYFRNGKIAKCPNSVLVKRIDERYGTDYYFEDEMDIEKTTVQEIEENLLNPCKMCKYCAPLRAEEIPWTTCGKNPKLSDWLIPHKYEYENNNLILEKRKLVSENNSVLSQNNSLISENKNLVSTNSSLISENKKLVSTNSSLISENNNIVSEKTDLESENRKIKEQIQNCSETIERIEKELDDDRNIISKMENENRALTEQWNQKTREYDDIIMKMEANNDKIIKETRVQIEELNKEITDQQIKIEEQQGYINDLQSSSSWRITAPARAVSSFFNRRR